MRKYFTEKAVTGHARVFTAALFLAATALPAGAFDLQGHRGARGLAPENTLAAFDRGLAAGVSTLELDIAVTADGVPVVSHDARLNPAITRDIREGGESGGRWLSAPGPVIASLPFAALAVYDVGRVDPSSRYAAGLPRQQPADGQRIPSLAELLRHLQAGGPAASRVALNIEIKSDPKQPELSPPPERMAALVIDTLRAAGMAQRATLQSFDWRGLAAARRIAPDMPRACLSTPATLRDPLWTAGLRRDDFATTGALVAAAGCTLWSPAFASLEATEVAEARRLGLKVVPWTVNRRADMQRMLDLGVDGLITDEPDVAAALLAERGIAIGR